MAERSYLREWRLAKRMTGTDLGKRAGITRSSVSRLEAGNRKMSLEHMRLLAQALGILPEQLFNPPPAIEFSNRIDAKFVRAEPQAAYKQGLRAMVGGVKFSVDAPYGLVLMETDEMHPTIEKGDHLVVDKSAPTNTSGIYVVAVGKTSTVRRIQKTANGFVASVDNKRYAETTGPINPKNITSRVVLRVSPL